jgi:hypothetical protein
MTSMFVTFNITLELQLSFEKKNTENKINTFMYIQQSIQPYTYKKAKKKKKNNNNQTQKHAEI